MICANPANFFVIAANFLKNILWFCFGGQVHCHGFS